VAKWKKNRWTWKKRKSKTGPFGAWGVCIGIGIAIISPPGCVATLDGGSTVLLRLLLEKKELPTRPTPPRASSPELDGSGTSIRLIVEFVEREKLFKTEVPSPNVPINVPACPGATIQSSR